jgi:hypothetical protein
MMLRFKIQHMSERQGKLLFSLGLIFSHFPAIAMLEDNAHPLVHPELELLVRGAAAIAQLPLGVSGSMPTAQGA